MDLPKFRMARHIGTLGQLLRKGKGQLAGTWRRPQEVVVRGAEASADPVEVGQQEEEPSNWWESKTVWDPEVQGHHHWCRLGHRQSSVPAPPYGYQLWYHLVWALRLLHSSSYRTVLLGQREWCTVMRHRWWRPVIFKRVINIRKIN